MSQLQIHIRSKLSSCRIKLNYLFQCTETRRKYTTNKDSSKEKGEALSDRTITTIEQKLGSSLNNKSVRYKLLDGKVKDITKSNDSNVDKDRKSVLSRVKDGIVLTFLPKGFPNSVSKGYLKYCKWQFIHNVTGTVTGVLSTQSLLYAMGLGAGSVPMAAALNWVIKDGLGQLGGVLYASAMGDKFDSNPKLHRMWAAISMQLATFLEILTPLFPHLFLPLASISNIGKNISWLASSATRAQMNSSFALRDNLGDITGRTGSQTTAAGLVGTTLGVGITPFVGTEISSILLAFFPLSGLSLYALYKANNAVVTKNLDQQRAELLLHQFVTQPGLDALKFQPDLNLLLTPDQVAAKEAYLLSYKSPFTIPVAVDVPIGSLLQSNPDLASSIAADHKLGRSYYIWVSNRPHKLQPLKVYLWYRKDINTLDVLQGFYTTCLLRHQLNKNSEKANLLSCIESARNLAQITFPQVHQKLLGTGWKLQTNFLGHSSQRIDVVSNSCN